MLAKRIKEIYQNRRDKTMFLNIDPNANYGEALKLIDSVRASGVEKLAVITLKEGEKFQIPGGVEPLAPSSP
jgi:biopolymer transport protein ExbD